MNIQNVLEEHILSGVKKNLKKTKIQNQTNGRSRYINSCSCRSIS